MKNSPSFRIWFQAWLIFLAGFLLVSLVTGEAGILFLLGFIGLVSFILGLPAVLVYLIAFWLLDRLKTTPFNKLLGIITTTALIAAGYAVPGSLLFSISNDFATDYWTIYFISAAFLFLCGLASVLRNRERIDNFFLTEEYYSDDSIDIDQPHSNTNTQNQITMDQFNQPSETKENHGNKALIKGMITGGLILVMLIPTIFIMNLIKEREQRQAEVVKDVSSKWASAQTITGPYIFIPYQQIEKSADGKELIKTKQLLFLPDNLEVDGNIIPEQRLRSIYKVLLYKSQINSKGNFVLQLPKDVDVASLALNDAKICVGITDFKGIEKKIDLVLNGATYTLSPGLPTDQLDKSGLSASIALTAENIGKAISFSFPLQIKGSEQLHFVPLSGNSQFTMKSAWANPSFDGNSIPSERNVTQDGFQAKWEFNKANLPFGTVLKESVAKYDELAFGISMVQPADQYAKTTRSVKYAILIIGLTFSLFFIIELMQKKPVHPVQYVLIGLSLVIFYTLLLSISEFLLFDLAYLVAALATILLITLYAKGHFKSWKTAGIFALLMSVLYAFIFVLIRLEDTALLVGSIGLFIVLALVMYASRKINWYHSGALAVE